MKPRKEQLAEWADIEKAATKGPWFVADDPGKTWDDHGMRLLSLESGDRKVYGEKSKVLRVKNNRTNRKEVHREADRQFVANSRTALPILLAAFRRSCNYIIQAGIGDEKTLDDIWQAAIDEVTGKRRDGE
jgi:hypothetical protein